VAIEEQVEWSVMGRENGQSGADIAGLLHGLVQQLAALMQVHGESVRLHRLLVESAKESEAQA
jgi:hypothetical protein